MAAAPLQRYLPDPIPEDWLPSQKDFLAVALRGEWTDAVTNYMLGRLGSLNHLRP